MRPIAALSILIALSLASTPAHAGGWGDFLSAFSASPCQDGWLGCVVGQQTISSNLVADTTGAPAPADLRVGWFDLRDLPSFSPFPDLSTYTGSPIATAPPAPRAPEPPRSEDAPPGPTPDPVQDDGDLVQRDDDRPPAPDDRPPLPPKADEPDCGSPRSLEPMALLGRLSPAQRGCLESGIVASNRPTHQDHLSRILIANAWAAGDREEWERLARRHLDEIDRSDPDLAYKYAVHLSRKGPGSADAVLRWADTALENKTVWTGRVYTIRVNALLKLRAQAAHTTWRAAEDRYGEAPTDASQAARERARNRAKVIAREWYDYATSAGTNAAAARELCLSAAGTAEYCSGG